MKWPQVPITQMAELNPRLPRELAENGDRLVSFVPMANVSEEGYIMQADERSLRSVRKGYTYFERGDVLVAKITPCLQNGKAAHATDLPHTIGFGTTEFHVLRPNSRSYGRYLFYMIWNSQFRFLAERSFTGSAGQKRVPTSFFERFLVPCPPFPEQKRIAGVLDEANELLRKRIVADKLAESLAPTIFREMFGDPTTQPNGWPRLSLHEVAPAGTGTFEPSATDTVWQLTLDQIPVGYDYVPEPRFGIASEAGGSTYPFDTKVVLYSKLRPNLNKVICPEAPGIATTELVPLRPCEDIIEREYLAAYLRSPFFVSWASSHVSGAKMPRVQMECFWEHQILLPPIGLQREFCERIKKLHELRKKQRDSSKEATALRDAFIEQAFKGEL